MRTKLCLLAVFLFCISLVKAEPPEEGKSIFLSRCAACHNVNKILTGPALAGVDTRHPIDWIVKFVNSSQTLIKNGDTAALRLFEKFNKIPMPDHPDLTEANIRSIVDYIKSETKTVTEEKPFARPGKKQPHYLPIRDYRFYLCYGIVVIGLVAALYFAVVARSYAGTKKEVIPV